MMQKLALEKFIESILERHEKRPSGEQQAFPELDLLLSTIVIVNRNPTL